MTAATLPSLRCGCGLYGLSGVAEITVDDVTHRPGRPCGSTPARPAGLGHGRTRPGPAPFEQASREAFVEATVRAATPEPAPVPGRENVLDRLVAQLMERSAFGVRKYGTPLESWNGRDAHLDARQELLDLFVYQEQAAMERADMEREIGTLRARVKELEQVWLDAERHLKGG